MPEIRLNALGDFGDALSVKAYCEGCGRSRDLDVRRLVRRYGAALSIAELKARLTCQRCRQRSPSIRISHSGRPGIERTCTVKLVERPFTENELQDLAASARAFAQSKRSATTSNTASLAALEAKRLEELPLRSASDCGSARRESFRPPIAPAARQRSVPRSFPPMYSFHFRTDNAPPSRKRGTQVAYTDRIKLIQQIEELRNSKVICYLTSIRPNFSAQMSDDAVRVMFNQMLLLPERPVKKLDIFLCSNGGSGTVPWRLISLFREFALEVAVLLPYRAYSAATLLALGADEIVMHPFAEMGPIDPTVSNDFNPVEAGGRRIGISVEDVKAYIAFIKTTVGIQHEDELIRAIEILAQKVHPLALGNVERFLSQSRMIAGKILRTHMTDEASKHTIDEIVENLASKLYFHGHPINRKEARKELGLKVVESPPPALETAMWQLYEDFEAELENRKTFDPMGALFGAYPEPQQVQLVPGQPSMPCILPPGTSTTFTINVAIVESARRSSRFVQKTRFVVASSGQNGEPMVRQETLAQAWEDSPAPSQSQT